MAGKKYGIKDKNFYGTMYRLLNTWEFDNFFLRQSRPSVETYIRDGGQYIFHNYVGHLLRCYFAKI